MTNPASGAPVLHSEPSLPCYVFAACSPSATLRVKVVPSKAVLDRRVRLRILVTVDIAGLVLPVPGASVWVGNGRHLYTNGQGRTSTTLAFGKAWPAARNRHGFPVLCRAGGGACLAPENVALALRVQPFQSPASIE